MGVQKEVSSFLLISVLLVAPSASLAGPVPSPTPTVSSDVSNSNQHQVQHPVVIPWGQGVASVEGGQAPVGGFIYCAGCAPISPGQLVIPANVPLSKALSAHGVIPPAIATAAQQEGVKASYSLDQQFKGYAGYVEPGKEQNIWNDGGVPVQQMALHDDGRYSFSYNTAHASRQEERNLDGSVSGSYQYTDPDGKLVQIDYTAGRNGYQAVGENVPPQQPVQLPQPVRDTLEVQMARQQFLQAYNQELERIQRDQEAAAAQAATSTVVPEGVGASSSTTPSSSEDFDGTTLTSHDDGEETEHSDDAIIVSGKTEHENNQDDLVAVPAPVVDHGHDHGDGVADDENDSIVISAKHDDEQDEEESPVKPAPATLPDPSYQISIPIGVGGNAGLSVQQNLPVVSDGRVQEVGNSNAIGQGQQGHAVAVTQNAGKNNLQPYFYYVSVGGQPHHVTSQSGYNSPYPTSLKATLLGALPLAAVHDTQVPTRAGEKVAEGGQTPASTRPIYLDPENSLKLDQQSQGQVPNIINPANLFMNNLQQQQQQQNGISSLGQLIPLNISPGSSATFGYIPALILNNNGNGASQGTVQPSEGSQMINNVPLHFQQQQQQQQQQVSGVPSLNNQPVIVLASKK